MRFLFPLFLILSMAFCKKPKVELTAQELSSIQVIFEQNQEIQNFLLKNESNIPPIDELKSSIQLAKTQVQNSEVVNSLSLLESALHNYDQADQKKAFDSLSQFSEELDKLAVLVNLGEYHKFFCPMVSKYWVSKGEVVHNPYAPEMRDCGELVR